MREDRLMQIKKPVKILGVPVHPLTMNESVAVLEEKLQKKNRLLWLLLTRKSL